MKKSLLRMIAPIQTMRRMMVWIRAIVMRSRRKRTRSQVLALEWAISYTDSARKRISARKLCTIWICDEDDSMTMITPLRCSSKRKRRA